MWTLIFPLNTSTLVSAAPCCVKLLWAFYLVRTCLAIEIIFVPAVPGTIITYFLSASNPKSVKSPLASMRTLVEVLWLKTCLHTEVHVRILQIPQLQPSSCWWWRHSGLISVRLLSDRLFSYYASPSSYRTWEIAIDDKQAVCRYQCCEPKT